MTIPYVRDSQNQPTVDSRVAVTALMINVVSCVMMKRVVAADARSWTLSVIRDSSALNGRLLAVYTIQFWKM